MKFFRMAVLGLTICCLLSHQPARAEKPVSKWEPAIQEFEKSDRKQPPAKGQILFIGSSSIKRWKLEQSFPELDALNRGFGGSQVSDSVEFFDRIVTPYQPRTIVFYAGDNDLKAKKSPERVAGDVAKFVKLAHESLPQAKVLYIAIKPSISRWSIIDKVRAANALIREQAAKDPLFEFIDIEPVMLGEDGQPLPQLFVSDGLHLSSEGYQRWSEILRPQLEVAAVPASR